MTTPQETILHDKNYVPVLDHGFVGLVDSMGNDSAIVQAARVSYGSGTKTVNTDRGLIRYLLRHKHTTPFEMCEFKFHAKMPIFVARQWVRHRTANINEYSGRYSVMSDEFYIPNAENLKPQSKDNKQGRDGDLSEIDVETIKELMSIHNKDSYDLYERLINTSEDEYNTFSEEFPGIARELGRMVLPVSNYTEWYWKIDLHNLFHFIKLRNDPHAQYEVRVYAEAMYNLIKPIVPVACEAFEDFVMNASNFSAQEVNLIKGMFNQVLFEQFTDEQLVEKFGLTKRELKEFRAKLNLDK